MAKINTNSFSIAHYILLFLVAGLCIVIIAWTMITRHNNNPQNNVRITHIHGNDPCVKRTIDVVDKMWEYDPKSIPDKYWEIAMDYMNKPITITTYGICQDVAFTCKIGQIRRECDPCAVPSAREYAKQIQIADMLESNCQSNGQK